PADTSLQDLALECVEAGADILEINLQQHYDRPEAMEFAVKSIQQATKNRQLCLSANNTETIEAGLKACKRPPLVNYVTVETSKLQAILPMIARYGAQVVLLITDPAEPSDAEQMMKKAAILVGAVNEVGIPNDDIFIDPGLIHVTHDQGQRHFTQVIEFMHAVPEAFSPQVKTVCWISNGSADAPERLRPVVETAILGMLSGLGLSSVFLNVLRPINMRMVRLIRILNNELVYSDDELELYRYPERR
ncbi:MAG: dihydropteroate synthase, partial [Dehalococcoidia bacterium]|nr:dihydropteroate synthase [Dehalococcoidia bacterium]